MQYESLTPSRSGNALPVRSIFNLFRFSFSFSPRWLATRMDIDIVEQTPKL